MIAVGQHQVLQIRNALCWQSGLRVDADGSPWAYHPNGGQGLDDLANAVDLVRDPAGNLVVQGQPVYDTDGGLIFDGKDQPAPGYYVSPNALHDERYLIYDARRYADAHSVCFVVLPPELRHAGVHFGDVAIVVHQPTGRTCSGIFGDGGNHGKLTEASIALVRALGLPPSARYGGADAPDAVAVLAWPGTARPWPRTNEDVAAQAASLLIDWGGTAALLHAVRAGVE